MAAFFNLMGLVIFLEIVFILISFWTIATLFFTKVPFARTPEANISKAIAQLNLPANAKFYDLGCGDGKALFLAEKLGYRVTGFELSPYPYFRAIIKKYFTNSKAEIHRSNFFNNNLSQADGVYLFLIKSIMPRVGEKLKKELRPGTPVISYAFQIPGWQAIKILDTSPSKTYIYHT